MECFLLEIRNTDPLVRRRRSSSQQKCMSVQVEGNCMECIGMGAISTCGASLRSHSYGLSKNVGGLEDKTSVVVHDKHVS